MGAYHGGSKSDIAELDQYKSDELTAHARIPVNNWLSLIAGAVHQRYRVNSEGQTFDAWKRRAGFAVQRGRWSGLLLSRTNRFRYTENEPLMGALQYKTNRLRLAQINLVAGLGVWSLEHVRFRSSTDYPLPTAGSRQFRLSYAIPLSIK